MASSSNDLRVAAAASSLSPSSSVYVSLGHGTIVTKKEPSRRNRNRRCHNHRHVTDHNNDDTIATTRTTDSHNGEEETKGESKLPLCIDDNKSPMLSRSPVPSPCEPPLWKLSSHVDPSDSKCHPSVFAVLSVPQYRSSGARQQTKIKDDESYAVTKKEVQRNRRRERKNKNMQHNNDYDDGYPPSIASDSKRCQPLSLPVAPAKKPNRRSKNKKPSGEPVAAASSSKHSNQEEKNTKKKSTKKSKKKSNSSIKATHHAVRLSDATDEDHLLRVLPWIYDTPLSLLTIGDRYVSEFKERPRQHGLIRRLFECALRCDPPVMVHHPHSGSHKGDVWQIVTPSQPVSSLSSSLSSLSSATIITKVDDEKSRWIEHVAHTIVTTAQQHWQSLRTGALALSSIPSLTPSEQYCHRMIRGGIRMDDTSSVPLHHYAPSLSVHTPVAPVIPVDVDSNDRHHHHDDNDTDDDNTNNDESKEVKNDGRACAEPRKQPPTLLHHSFHPTIGDRIWLRDAILPLMNSRQPKTISQICASSRRVLTKDQVHRLEQLFNWACRDPKLMRDYPGKGTASGVTHWKLMPHEGKTIAEVAEQWIDTSMMIERELKLTIDGTKTIPMIDIIYDWQRFLIANTKCYLSCLVGDLIHHTRQQYDVALTDDDIKRYVCCNNRFKLHGHGPTRVITLIDHDPHQTDQHNRNEARDRAKFFSGAYTTRDMCTRAARLIQRLIRADPIQQPVYEDVQRELEAQLPDAPSLDMVLKRYDDRFIASRRNKRLTVIRFVTNCAQLDDEEDQEAPIPVGTVTATPAPTPIIRSPLPATAPTLTPPTTTAALNGGGISTADAAATHAPTFDRGAFYAALMSASDCTSGSGDGFPI